MKRLLPTLLTLVLLLTCIYFLLPTEANAATVVKSGTCGENLTWTLDDAGTLTISGTGAMDDFYDCVIVIPPDDWSLRRDISKRSASAPWADYSGKIRNVVVKSGVTTIGDYAFYGCTSLASVTIGNSVTAIGTLAFSNCTSLTSVTIPNSVTTIGDYAFSDCYSLTSVTIGNSVTTIGTRAFSNCTSLTSVTIPNSVTSIGDYAFYNCTKLASVTIPNSVTTIGDYAFYGCTSLTSLTIPDSVITIGYEAIPRFSASAYNTYSGGYYLGNDKNLYRVFVKPVSDNVTTISFHPDTKIIAPRAFTNNDSLTSVSIPVGVISIGHSAFHSCDKLTSVTLPNSVTTIGVSAFNQCSRLTSVIIPSSVTDIGSIAFYESKSLRYTIYQGGKYLGNNKNPYHALIITASRSITQITIHPDTQVIAGNAFYECNDLTDVYYDATQEQWDKISIGANNFSLMNATLHLRDHIFDEESSVVTQQPTCTQTGSAVATCTLCGTKKEIEVPALGHNFDFGDIIEEATCQQSGMKICTCMRCDATEDVVIPALGHKITNHAAKAATCLDIGWNAYDTCGRCDYTTYKAIPALGHAITHHTAQAPTCLDIGWNAYDTCGRCDYTTYQEIPSLGGGQHIFGDWIVQTAATNTTTGSKYHTCVNCNLREDKTIPRTLRFQAAGLTLKSNIQVNFKVGKAMFDSYGYTDAYAVFELNGRKITIDTYRLSGSYYTFDFTELTPAMLGDTITGTLYATYEGEVYASTPKTYSVLQYCTSQLNSADIAGSNYATFRTLLVDMLNYGSAAQQYVNYKTDALVSDNLTAAQKAWGTQVDTPAVNELVQAEDMVNPTAAWKGGKLLLSDSVAVVITIQAENTKGLTVVMTDAYGNVYTYTAEDLKPVEGKADRYTLEIGDLGVGQMRDAATFVAYQNGVQASKTLTYSIQSYVATNGSGTGSLAVLLRAMLRYGDSAKAYATK